MKRSDIIMHGGMRTAIRAQAAAFLALHSVAPRLGSVFGTHQRYLMSQAFLALAFRSKDRSVLMAEFLKAIRIHKLASPNTAEAFVREMLHYGFGFYGISRQDRRCRPIFLTDSVYLLIGQWLAIHLRTLDSLDGGGRLAELERRPELLALAHPFIVDAVMVSDTGSQPTGTFSLFTWLNEGGLVMDRMMATLPDFPDDAEQVPTNFTRYTDLEESLRISRTHLIRKLGMAERMGSLGWQGQRNRSTLWVSRAFIAEYDAYQAEKLAIIAHCFAAAAAA
ncbi:hypothetical protein GCM10007301_38020 [Azorhizobium oxalatiphilum]|uniref:Uncharacterized protein n=2 Tax=Azorhizobium oxalatiphilum TaxID=980631 RepID=A0A917C6I8_9HYPH|nr:hypothetical protein GCM10007301_38020 [Azorhizobium oxalatiphilum]